MVIFYRLCTLHKSNIIIYLATVMIVSLNEVNNIDSSYVYVNSIGHTDEIMQQYCHKFTHMIVATRLLDWTIELPICLLLFKNVRIILCFVPSWIVFKTSRRQFRVLFTSERGQCIKRKPSIRWWSILSPR